MNPLKVTIHRVGTGVCSLTGKEGDGLSVTFEDGTVRDGFLSWKAFRQLCSMKQPMKAVAEQPKPNNVPAAVMVK